MILSFRCLSTKGREWKRRSLPCPVISGRSLDGTVAEVKELWSLGIKSVLLFVKSKDELKDNTGKEAWNPDGLMQRSIKAIKEAVPEMVVMTDVALDPYSIYGHDGIVENGEIVNDPTVEALIKMSLSHAWRAPTG
jgi:porphobilinogen synthase